MKYPYWIYWTVVDDTIIFMPDFNECLDEHIDNISKCRILYFSNYSNPHLALKNNNKYIHDSDNYDAKFYKGSLFDKPLGNSLSTLVDLQKITFGCDFCQFLDNSLSNLVNLSELTFGYKFNRQLGDSLLNLFNLEKLTFGDAFNQPLNISL